MARSNGVEVYSWNVNGVRSVASQGFLGWLQEKSPDVLCLQETKAREDQLTFDLTKPRGYESYWYSAEKPGYSGVAIYSKNPVKDLKDGIGFKEADREGRVLTAFFEDLVVISAYFPNSQRDHARLSFKLEFCEAIFKYCEKLRKQGYSVVLCGDYNIAHKEIDLKNPKSNAKNAGFLPEERAWMDLFTTKGWVDTFRHFHPEPGQYTWWSYRPGVRERNIGWRIDYHCVNQEMMDRVESSVILPEVYGSDHCPVAITIGASK